MSEIDPAIAGAITAVGAALLGVVRWAVGLWATVRREDIASAKESARLAREADVRMVDRQIAVADKLAERIDDHTTKDLAHHAGVREAIVRLDAKFDAAFHDRTDTVDETPSERRRRTRLRTHPEGHLTDTGKTRTT